MRVWFLAARVMSHYLVANNTEFKDLISVDVSETPVSNPLLDKLEDLPVLSGSSALHGKSQEMDNLIDQRVRSCGGIRPVFV